MNSCDISKNTYSPRVLVISNNSFSNVYNNGKTLEALFSSFPKENIAQLFFHEASDPDFSFCNQYWKISELDLIQHIGKKSKSIGSKKAPALLADNKRSLNAYPKLLLTIKEKTGNLSRDVLWKLCTWESPALYEWLLKYEPQVIFFVGSSASFSSRVALRLSYKLKIPLAIYYTDDYLFSLPQRTFIQKRKYNHIKRIYSEVIDSSSACFAIGELMAKEYTLFFKKEFIPIMNSVLLAPYEEYRKNAIINIVYFGGLHLNRWQMIVKLAKLLPDNAMITVYTAKTNINEVICKAFDNFGVHYHDLLSGDDLNKAMLNADILLHVESDDEMNRRFTRLAISTKIPEYLMSGRPILAFGPTEVASMKLLSDNSIGYIINSVDSDDTIRGKIIMIVSNYEYRRSLGLRGYNYAKKHFDRTVISQQLLSKLQEISHQ